MNRESFPVATPLPGIQPRVLLVDGDAGYRQHCAGVFTAGGCFVIEARDGREALVQSFTTRISAVVTELRLEYIGGPTLCEILRSDRANARVPLVVVTEHAVASALNPSTRASVDAVFIKPIAPAVVLSEMARLLRQRERIAATISADPCHRTRTHHGISASSSAVPLAILSCPVCSREMKYLHTLQRSVTLDRIERWDYYDCPACGRFQYRWRTRTLRHQ